MTSVIPPAWIDAQGRRRPTLTRWTCGRAVAPMHLRTGDLRPHGWEPSRTLFVPDWCGGTTEYVPVPAGPGAWELVPIWDRPGGEPAPARHAARIGTQW